MKTLVHISKRVAVVFIACLVVATSLIFSVEAFRVKFLNYLFEMKTDHATLQFGNDEEHKQSVEISGHIVNYVPEGFSLINSEINKIINASFENKNTGQKFNIRIRPGNGNMGIDTENADYKKIKVNENDAFLLAKDTGNVSLYWHNNENVFSIVGSISASEIIKIAESIKK